MALCTCTHWFELHRRNGVSCEHCYCAAPVPIPAEYLRR